MRGIGFRDLNLGYRTLNPKFKALGFPGADLGGVQKGSFGIQQGFCGRPFRGDQHEGALGEGHEGCAQQLLGDVAAVAVLGLSLNPETSMSLSMYLLVIISNN